jgi:iron complex transport system permease protein
MNSAGHTFRNRAILLTVFLLGCFFLDLFSGSYHTSFSNFLDSIFNYNNSDTSQLVMREFRIPRAVTALLAGSALSVCGLLMQTLFNNPLAGPYALGISSGSSLFVAIGSLTGIQFFLHDFGMVLLAFSGAILFGGIILLSSVRIKTQISLLLVGLMLGSMAGAIITTLEATASAQELRAYTMWTMGSLQNTHFDQLPLFTVITFLALVGCLLLIKPLNALVLGEEQAALLGIQIKRFRFLTILITAVLSGTITAFCGPIAFVGLAVPNIAKMLFKTASHLKLLVGCFLIGGSFLLLADILIQMLEPYFIVPVNALTSLIGAPVIIYLIIKRWA